MILVFHFGFIEEVRLTLTWCLSFQGGARAVCGPSEGTGMQWIDYKSSLSSWECSPSTAASSKSTTSIAQMQQQQPGRMQYKCPYCDHVAQKKFNLEKHIRTHTGERPFHCHLCSYSSGDSSNLRSHIKKKHRIMMMESAAIMQNEQGIMNEHKLPFNQIPAGVIVLNSPEHMTEPLSQ
ncbi:unnamed protein product [Meganyctiphanes norvegica]|uniref:C2H2-type domain-containing protein n=1 Tax=Meganyctiphanes norvegica TaxID=48144 RepID=A0AAV2SWJ2_MEGNR